MVSTASLLSNWTRGCTLTRMHLTHIEMTDRSGVDLNFQGTVCELRDTSFIRTLDKSRISRCLLGMVDECQSVNEHKS